MAIYHSLTEYYDNSDAKTQKSIAASVKKINIVPPLPNNLPNLIREHKESLGVSLEKYVELHNWISPNHLISINTFKNYINKNQRPDIERLNHLLNFLNIDRQSLNDFWALKPSELLSYASTFFNSRRDIDDYLAKTLKNIKTTAQEVDHINEVLLGNNTVSLKRLEELKHFKKISPLGIEKIDFFIKQIDTFNIDKNFFMNDRYQSLYSSRDSAINEIYLELYNLNVNNLSISLFFDKIISATMNRAKLLQKIDKDLYSLNSKFQIALESHLRPDEFETPFDERTLLFGTVLKSIFEY